MSTPVSRTSSEASFSSASESPSGRATPYSPPSILLDKSISDTWRFVMGTTFRPLNEPRSVTFNPKKQVDLIATRKECESAGILADTQWKETDYDTFKEETLKELTEYMKKNEIKDIKKAMKLLYQP
jgi:hypothetical protein